VFIELIDLLRCPNQHADSWMVAAFNKMDGRFVVDGRLGCPICSRNYEIRDGIADLRVELDDLPSSSREPENGADGDAALRAAALLGLSSPRSLVLLVGAAAGLGEWISEMTEARVMAINPFDRISETERIASIRVNDRFPFAPVSVDAIMLDDSASETLARDAGRVLRQGGRLVGPSTLRVDGQFRELARDERNVVAESVGQLISLSR
jgi:uncharacterized protein YbaR (Trm112 family)